MSNVRSILVVDDDPELASALTEQLALHDEFETRTVDTAGKAIADSGIDAGPRGPSAANACSVDVATFCDEAPGTLSTAPCELGCNDAETSCARVLPSNVDPALFDGDAPAWTVPTNATYDTSECTGGTVAPQLAPGPRCACGASRRSPSRRAPGSASPDRGRWSCSRRAR